MVESSRVVVARHFLIRSVEAEVTDDPERVPVRGGIFDETVHVSLSVDVDGVPENIVVPGKHADDDVVTVLFPQLQALTDLAIGGLRDRAVRGDSVRCSGEWPASGE